MFSKYNVYTTVQYLRTNVAFLLNQIILEVIMMKKNTIFFIAISVFIELAIAILLCILIPSPANATSSYEYIIDSENLFDDSSEMLTMAKKIRNKLDFNIHIFSVENIESAETIIKDYMQDASALLIFISKDEIFYIRVLTC